MLQNPNALDQLVADRRAALLREAEVERLARLARPRSLRVSGTSSRARLAEALRSLADRLEPAPSLSTASDWDEPQAAVRPADVRC
jgi:hypothetical protein